MYNYFIIYMNNNLRLFFLTHNSLFLIFIYP
jgi:hypothetical protein